MAAAGSAKSESRPKTNDGKNEFAGTSGPPQHESLGDLLSRYVPSDRESFERLIKPSLKAQAQALDVAKVAMAGLDSMMAHLVQRRKTCGDQIEGDLVETAWIDKEVAKKEAEVNKIKKHLEECKHERDTMQKALKDSVETMQESVKYCNKMTQKTNSNIARLTRTMAPKGNDNFLKSGMLEKDETLLSNKFRDSATVSKTAKSNMISTSKSAMSR